MTGVIGTSEAAAEAQALDDRQRHGDREQQPLISPQTKTWLRAGFVLLCLAPVTVLLGMRLARFTDDPVFATYGVLVLFTTAEVMFVAFAFYRDPSQRGAEVVSLEQPLVSCLVACKDDVDVIARCVTSMLEQSYANLEVIAIDDGSTDGSYEELQKLLERYPKQFTLLRNEESAGKKRALVRASAASLGEFMVFTDSDCVIDPEAVAQVMQGFQRDPRIGAISGDARALNANRNLLTKIQDTWYDGQFSIWKATESVFGSVSCVSGPLAAFRREAIWNYLPAWAEDSFLGQEFRFATDRQLTGYVLGQKWIGRKLKEQHAGSAFVEYVDYPERHWRVEYVKSAMVWTNVPPTLRLLTKQQTRWKKSFIRNLFFTGSFLWRRGPLPAFLFYGHVLWVCAAPLLAFRHLIWLPLHGSILLTGVYLCGVSLKGSVWALAYKVQNPSSTRWLYRPLMSLLSTLCLSWVLPYSAMTLRKSVWSRG